jgi:hypothetical protein
MKLRFFGPLLHLRDYSVQPLARNLCCKFSSQCKTSTTLEGSIFIDIRINRTPTLAIYHGGNQWDISAMYILLQTILFGLFLVISYVALHLLVSLYDAIIFVTMTQHRPRCSKPVMIVADIIIDDVPSGTLCVSLAHFFWSCSTGKGRACSLRQGNIGIAFKMEADVIDIIALSSTVTICVPIDIGWLVSRAVRGIVNHVHDDSTKLNNAVSPTAHVSVSVSNFRMTVLRYHNSQQVSRRMTRVNPAEGSSGMGTRDCGRVREAEREARHPGTVGTYLLLIYIIETCLLPRPRRDETSASEGVWHCDGENVDSGGWQKSHLEPRAVLALLWLVPHLMRSQEQVEQESLSVKCAGDGAVNPSKSLQRGGGAVRQRQQCEVVADRRPGSCPSSARLPPTGDAASLYSHENILHPFPATFSNDSGVSAAHNSISVCKDITESVLSSNETPPETLTSYHTTPSISTATPNCGNITAVILLSLSVRGLRVDSIPPPLSKCKGSRLEREKQHGIELTWDDGHADISVGSVSVIYDDWLDAKCRHQV